MSNGKTAFLGPEATFSHAAALKFFPKSELLPEKSIQDVFEAVKNSKAGFGVVPVENSTEGSVNVTLDLLADCDLSVIRECSVPISHCLLSKSKSISEIKLVHSHPQALAQCRKWLEKNLPNAELAECSSTARAAEIALQNNGSAAIASRLAAEKFGIGILAEDVQDFSGNITRFLAISKNPAIPSGKAKTMILFSTMHKPGALFDVLKSLKVYNVNMTRIESRPSKKTAWEYVFFVDVEGRSTEPGLTHAFEEIKQHCKLFRILGSFEVLE